jgi:hypothetical protein
MSISAADILSVTRSVTAKWTKQRKAEERGRSRGTRMHVYSDRVNFTDVVDSILPDAYQHASGGGNYSVSKRQLYYACREQFKQRTGRELEAQYFSGTLLVQYLNRNPQTTASWKITADPRGTLTIPNAGHEVRVGCGTLQIEQHLRDAATEVDPTDIATALDTEWPSLAAGQRYQAVLYIEKEGFEPLLKEAKIAERFDIAILSCKGQSVVAARHFVDEVCAVGTGVPLFVGHDLDKAGFEISQRLTKVSDWAVEYDRVAYDFKNEIQVTDVGLRLADVKKYGLASETVTFKGHFASDSICTADEKEFLRSGRRVELNAFTSPQFIEWLEGKLTEHLPKRLIPGDDVLAAAYRRAQALAHLNAVLADAKERAIERAESAKVPKTLRRQLTKQMKAEGGAWDSVLYEIAASLEGSDDE